MRESLAKNKFIMEIDTGEVIGKINLKRE